MTFSSIHDGSHLYFVTAALCGWKHLFNQPAYADIVLGSLSWLRREKRMSLYAFVLMPSHIHTIVKPIDLEIGTVVQNFGSFTAHAILLQLRKEEKTDLIQFFQGQTIDNRH